ncbi:MAG TPA: MFS transporter [Hyphomicrobiaceae bacterium]|jgi:AAA family ATP:ADP antiporter|nr:MFS transporter [Hyphomicrobiaceae bacterium]HEX2335408.1 MFS transporter [Hyphomicrobiaceae bacterium]
MQETTPSTAGWLEQLIGRIVIVERREIPQLLSSFAFFFCVLAAYYVIRPVREEMGVRVGREWLQTLFVIVFFVMLAVVPLFGWVASRLAKRRIVMVIYTFFVLNLVIFWGLFSIGNASVYVAGMFFVWVSVFNLFAVSLFWSTMADTYSSDDAKRLYGLIAAGGSIGAISGPLITQSLVHVLGTANLLLVSAGLLCGALAAAQALRTAMGTATTQDEHLSQGGLLAGAVHVWRSPYLFRIALWVLIANLIGTFFYFEQARIIGAAYTVATDRVQLFARMDLAVNTLTILGQVLVTARLLQRVGIGVAAAALPISGLLGLLALAAAPVAAVIVGVMIIERAVTFAIANPALRVLFTVVPTEDKYKAQNFIDTVVFRGGDAASGWVFGSLAKSLGVGMSTVALLTVPLAAVWAGMSLALGRRQAELADKDPSSRRARSPSSGIKSARFS